MSGEKNMIEIFVNYTDNPCVNFTNGTWNTTVDCNNASSSDYEYDWDYFWKIEFPRVLAQFAFPRPHEWFLIAMYVLVFILALSGNILVCIAVLRNPQMRTVTNYYILNLSIADILVSLICLPVTVVYDTTETWYFGDIACKLVPYFQVVSMSVSVLTLSAIAVDRYFAICQPLMFKTTARRALTTILIIWVVSFIIPIPQSVMHVTEPTTHADSPFSYLSLTKCYEKLWQETIQQKIYHVVLVCIIYIIPLSMVTVAYILVCKQLWAAIPGSERCDRKSSPTKNGVVNRPAENQILSRRKVAKMLIIVAVIFAVCYLPLHLLNIIRQFPSVFEFVDDLSQRDVFHVPFLVAHWLAYANSATNPIIYNFLSAKFRKEFRAAFACCCLSRQSRARRGRRGGYRSSYFASTSKSYGVSTTEQITLSSLRRSSDKVRV